MYFAAFLAIISALQQQEFDMTLNDLLQQLQRGEAQFADVLAFIDTRYQHTPTAFQNGDNHNRAEQNQGSAKVLFFAQQQQLDKAATLSLFAEHYQAVLANPQGNDHQNIRQFMQHGWDGVRFEGTVLTAKSS